MAKASKNVKSTASPNTKRKASSSGSSKTAPAPKAQKKNDGSRSSPSNSGSSRGNGSSVKVLESFKPIKATNDPNDYKILKLSNGLRVCLISRKSSFGGSLFSSPGKSKTHPLVRREISVLDKLFRDHIPPRFLPAFMPYVGGLGEPSSVFGGLFDLFSIAESTSVAAVINIGGLDDPEDAQGLAHFTEHVAHYGSRKFPREEAVSELVWNFGTGNAFTTLLNTAYYNSVSDLVLEKNLELFSEMLTNPSMEVDLIQREVKAVDNEFYLLQPFLRKQLLLSHVGYEPIHPLARVWIGKLETLGGATPKGSANVQQIMKQNHRTNYVASAMTLALNSSKTMPQMESLVLNHFSKLQEGKRQVQHETSDKDSTKHNLKLSREGRHIFLQGISSIAELTLRWHLPASIYLNGENEKTMDIIKFLLSNPSDKGLIAHLKEKELVWAANVYQSSTPYAILLEMDYLLTEKGLSNESTSYILKATEEYIKYLQAVGKVEMERYFDQLRVYRLRNFDYGTHATSSLQTTLNCALKLQDVERPQEILTFDSWRNAKFNFDVIKEALDRMTGEPGVTVIETIPKQFSVENKLDEIEVKPKPIIKEAPYTKAKYFEIPRERVEIKEDFSHAFRGDKALQPVSKLTAPKIYGKIQMLQPLKYKSKADQPDNPKISGLHLGHSGTSYQGVVSIIFNTPEQRSSSPRGTALAWLWVFYLRQRLATFAANFALAGCDFSIRQSSGSLFIRVRGFPTHIEEVSTKILEKVFDHPMSESTFSLAKEDLKQNWEIYLGETGALTAEIISTIMFARKELKIDSYGILQELTLNDLRLFIQANRSSTSALVLLAGNVPVTVFNNLAATLDKMNFAPFVSNNPVNLNFMMPSSDLHTPGEFCVRVKNWANCTFTNSITNLYVLGRFNENQDHQAECFDVAMKYINQQAFMFLRTREQLAYVVYAGPMMILSLREPVMAFAVGIIATAKKFTLCELDRKIDEFLSEYGDNLSNIPDDIYNKMAELEEFKVTKQEVGKWFNSKFGRGFRKRDTEMKCLMKGIRKVSVQEIGAGNPEAETRKCNCDLCGGIQKWVQGRNHESYLEFAVGDKGHKDYFIQV